MTDIARSAEVHTSTVSRALAGSPLAAKEKRDFILKLARKRGFVVNSIASNLRLRRTKTAAPASHRIATVCLLLGIRSQTQATA
jgi:DNA-binding LacI/PurR family transcriptional regulator